MIPESIVLGKVILNQDITKAYMIQNKTFIFLVCNSNQYVFTHGYVPCTLLDAADLIVRRTWHVSPQNV